MFPMGLYTRDIKTDSRDRKRKRLNSTHISISFSPFFFFSTPRRPPRSPLFPSTTLFRSHQVHVITCVPNVPNGIIYEGYKNRFKRSEEKTPQLHSHFHIFFSLLFFFNTPAPTEISTLSLHDALPISPSTCNYLRSQCSQWDYIRGI